MGLLFSVSADKLDVGIAPFVAAADFVAAEVVQIVESFSR